MLRDSWGAVPSATDIMRKYMKRFRAFEGLGSLAVCYFCINEKLISKEGARVGRTFLLIIKYAEKMTLW